MSLWIAGGARFLSSTLGVVDTLERVAARQAGLIRRDQLRALGIDKDRIRNQVRAARWVRRSPTVISTFTGELTRHQMMWLGVLHAGHGSVLGDLTAAEVGGLRNWQRDEIRVVIPHQAECADLPGFCFIRTRHDVTQLRAKSRPLPRLRLEPAVLMYAARTTNTRSAQGALAAAVQQRLTRPQDLQEWIDRLRPLRRAPLLRRTLQDIEGGSTSVAEIDLARLCRRYGLAIPHRQTKRRDSSGRTRWTDAEWQLGGGHALVLEVDGSFHMSAEHWEDDLARQRRLSLPGLKTFVHCTARELRDEPDEVAQDLIRLGVPRAAKSAS